MGKTIVIGQDAWHLTEAARSLEEADVGVRGPRYVRIETPSGVVTIPGEVLVGAKWESSWSEFSNVTLTLTGTLYIEYLDGEGNVLNERSNRQSRQGS